VQDINLYHLLKFYVKKWPFIIGLTAIGALAGFVYNTYIQVPLYKSDATLLLVNTDSAKVAQNTTLINNYIELLKSRRVLEPVLNDQNHVMTYEELAGAITTTNDKGTEVIKVSVASKDASTSKKLADGVVSSFRDEVKNIYKLNNISIVDNASTVNVPYNVHQVLFLAISSTAGLFLSVIILSFVYDLKMADLTLTSSDEARRKSRSKMGIKSVKTKAAAKKSIVVKSTVKDEVKITPRKRTTSNPLSRRILNLLVGVLDDQPLGYVEKEKNKSAEK
jgi:capsular polysaccharide biosynthesis protein